MSKKSLIIGVLVIAAVIGYAAISSTDRAEFTTDAYAAAPAPTLKGTAYVIGHGGHVAIVDLETEKILDYIPTTPSRASHAITMSHDRKTLYVASLDGYITEVDIAAKKAGEWVKLGDPAKTCGSSFAPDGSVWISDMKSDKVWVYSPKTKKLADVIELSGHNVRATCGITFSRDGKTAYITDMPGGFTLIVDVKSRKAKGKIEVGDFTHRSNLSADGKSLLVADGREQKAGQPQQLTGRIQVVNLKSNKVTASTDVSGNPHDVVAAPGGQYAVVSSRNVPEKGDSGLEIIDLKDKKVVKTFSACNACHKEKGVMEMVGKSEDKDKQKVFLCGVEVAWKK